MNNNRSIKIYLIFCLFLYIVTTFLADYLADRFGFKIRDTLATFFASRDGFGFGLKRFFIWDIVISFCLFSVVIGSIKKDPFSLFLFEWHQSSQNKLMWQTVFSSLKACISSTIVFSLLFGIIYGLCFWLPASVALELLRNDSLNLIGLTEAKFDHYFSWIPDFNLSLFSIFLCRSLILTTILYKLLSSEIFRRTRDKWPTIEIVRRTGVKRSTIFAFVFSIVLILSLLIKSSNYNGADSAANHRHYKWHYHFDRAVGNCEEYPEKFRIEQDRCYDAMLKIWSNLYGPPLDASFTEEQVRKELKKLQQISSEDSNKINNNTGPVNNAPTNVLHKAAITVYDPSTGKTTSSNMVYDPSTGKTTRSNDDNSISSQP